MSGKSVLGFIGLGSMGSAMAPHLLGKDAEVIAFDAVASSAQAFADAGGKTAGSAAEIGEQADIVFLSLPTPAIVTEVARAVAAGKPRIIVDLSTTGPRAAAAIADEMTALGIQWVDAPVSGGRGGALNAKLSLMVACEKGVWAEVEPLLQSFGKTFHVGEKSGQAQMMKLVNNMISVAALAATSEGMAMGVKFGLDPATMIEVLNNSSGKSSASTDKFPRAVLTRSFNFGFQTQLSLKDMRMALEEADAMGVPIMVGTAARTLLTITQADFGPQSDFTEMAKVLEDWAKIETPAA